MPEETPPATPQAGTTGRTPAPAATTPTPQAGAGKTPDDYERMLAELRHENAGHRTKLKSFEEAEALRLQAQMSELEKAQKQAADLQEQHDTMAVELLEARVHQEVGKLASTMNFVLPVDILARLLLTDSEAIEFDDNAKPTNIEKLLEKLAKATPDLVKTEQQQQQQRGAPALPAMSPGRSSIQAPGTTTPGKKPSWSDVKWSGQ